MPKPVTQNIAFGSVAPESPHSSNQGRPASAKPAPYQNNPRPMNIPPMAYQMHMFESQQMQGQIPYMPYMGVPGHGLPPVNTVRPSPPSVVTKSQEGMNKVSF
jgi:hypothetical protein